MTVDRGGSGGSSGRQGAGPEAAQGGGTAMSEEGGTAVGLRRILGYTIPAHTRVVINAWAIGRDPAAWGQQPDEFSPEKFLNGAIDYKGQDFELLPFGAGRRGCPGIVFGVSAMEIALASLLYHFDWEAAATDHRRRGSQAWALPVDMSEVNEIAVHLKYGLHVVAKPRMP
uniref:Cytochrome P450 n=1 Tax=Oryza nivara TaxID=4536 RepID=A0A0E0FIX7_ORYNI